MLFPYHGIIVPCLNSDNVLVDSSAFRDFNAVDGVKEDWILLIPVDIDGNLGKVISKLITAVFHRYISLATSK